MIDAGFADSFAKAWVEAWNRHDLDAVLSHYTDDFEMTSPFIVQIAGEPSGTLKGKPAVRGYWTTALQRVPDLRFELREVLSGVDSVTIYYRGARGMAAEVFHFTSGRLVDRAWAHYA